METSQSISLAQNLYCAEQLQRSEARAGELAGYSLGQLMSLAGRSVFGELERIVGVGASIAICCGEGNNGGDGYIVARLAHQAGYKVSLYALNAKAELKQTSHEPAVQARRACRELGLEERPLTDCTANDYDLIVDAVFGIGLSRPVEGALAEWVRALNKSRVPVLAIDVPSGINADSGCIMGEAIVAQVTVTMIAYKRGLFTGASPGHVGRIVLADLGAGKYFERLEQPAWRRVTENPYGWLGDRVAHSHKGTHGHVLIVGAGPGMPGAAILAMVAALRAGAGTVSVACHPSNVGIIASQQPEAMVHGVEAPEQLNHLLNAATSLVVGPGLGRDEWGYKIYQACMAVNTCKVIDADGLYWLAQDPVHSSQLILTPHPGEAARLLKCNTRDIEANRFEHALSLHNQYHAQIVLKGAGSLISSTRGNWLIDRGSPAMASGGMGDCLAGLIGALVAQGLAPAQALTAGVYWHAVAGEVAGSKAPRGTLASDLMPIIRKLVNGWIPE